jgi:hypothetical protein
MTMKLQRVVGLAEEVTYATPIANPDFHMEVSDSSIAIEGDPLKFESGLSRDLTLVRPGPYIPQPEFSGLTDLKTIGHFLKGVLGGYEYTAGVGEDPNVHEIWGSEDLLLPSFTLFGHFDLFVKKVAGALIQSVSLEVSNEFIELAVKTVGSKDSKTNGVPEPTTLKTLVGVVPLTFYEVSMQFGGEVPPGIVSSLKWEVSNDIKTDDAAGIGSRFMVRKPSAGKRTNTLEFEVSLEPETLKYLEMFEYGEQGATQPSGCKMTTVPIELVLEPCDPSVDEKLTISFPDNLAKVEYSASGSDAIKLKISLESLATTPVELNDGVTEIITSVYCKLENEIPELVPGGVVMQGP